MKVLSFEDYKATGKIKYVETHVSSSSTGTNGINVDEFIKSELEEMSYIMEMSTDELEKIAQDILKMEEEMLGTVVDSEIENFEPLKMMIPH